MKKHLLLGMAILLAFVTEGLAANNKHSPEEQSVIALIKRILPDHYEQFVVEIVSQEKDFFEIDNRDGIILLRGNNGVSIASALNWYMKYYLNASVSWCSDQLDLSEALTPVPEKIRKDATVPYRYFYNYTAYGYTMPWWGWKEWEREIDLMAMNGINLPLILTGQEAVFVNTYIQYGYTDEEIRTWLGSVAHLPWFYMQNLENYGGAVPKTFIGERSELAEKIIQRARGLGMKIVLQSFYGMVPPDFEKKNPGARVLPQGNWGVFKRQDMLDPANPYFKKLAKTFLLEQEKLYGRAGFYTGDPFHEGGNAEGVDMAACGETIINSMMEIDPEAVWVKQCWQKDYRELLQRVPSERVMALDLWCDSEPFWNRSHAFNGKNWVWCYLQNFGGNTDLGGDMNKLAHIIPDTLNAPDRGNMVGIGVVPEGTMHNPAAFDLMQEFAWRHDSVDLKAWFRRYTERRYGKRNKHAQTAWEIIQATPYSVDFSESTPGNPVFAARPLRANPLKARTWGSTFTHHDASRFVFAWKELLAAADDFEISQSYRYDLIDVTRQIIVDATNSLRVKAMEAYQAKDSDAFKAHTTLFLDMVSDLDTLLGSHKNFLLGIWLEDAKNTGKTPEEKAMFEYQARNLLTLWNGHPNDDINDYANRQWNGLLKDYYHMRWAMYFRYLQESLEKNENFREKAFLDELSQAELAWVNARNSYPAKPVGDTIAIARKLYKKYGTLCETMHTPLLAPTKEMISGSRWHYIANGENFAREFRADGTVKAYHEGKAVDWLEGLTWDIHGNDLVNIAPNGRVSLRYNLINPDIMVFKSEQWGKLTREQ